MKKGFLLPFLFSVLLTSPLFGQNSKSGKFLSDFVSRTWTASDGLTGNTINSLIQDSKGYIWIGTYEGLVRFDGIEFTVMNRNYNPDYNFVSARSLFLDSAGNIWVGANDEGVSVLRTDGTVQTWTIDNGIPNNSIRSFCQDPSGNIWVGTASGICCIGPDGKIFVPSGLMRAMGENKSLVIKLYCDSAGRVWVTTQDDGVYLYANKMLAKWEGLKSFDSSDVTVVSQSSQGDLWLGVSPHYLVNIKDSEEKVYDLGVGPLKGTKVNSIIQDSLNNIWVGLDTGICIIHGGEVIKYDQSMGLCDEKISQIMQDREDNIWICTDRGGIQKFSVGKFKTIPMDTSINAIADDDLRNCVWLAGDDGLHCWNGSELVENDLTRLCRNIRIRHVEITADGELLVSTYKKLGQIVYGTDNSIKAYTEDDGLAGMRCRVAIKASDGTLYVGTTTGLSVIGPDGTIDNYTRDDGLVNAYIMCIYEDPDHNIWVGTDGGGVFMMKDRKVVKSYTSEEGLVGNVIFKISSLDDNTIMICTGGGISVFRDQKFYSLNSSTGIGVDGVFQVIEDYSGKLWLTSNRGLASLNVSELEDYLSGKVDRIRTKYYGRSDGLTSGGITSTSLSMKDKAGRIWFTLIDGFAIYDPIRISNTDRAPLMDVQEILVDNAAATQKDGCYILRPNSKRLSIKYTGLSFVSTEQVLFSYKLEGFDTEFSDWSLDRTVSYTNLKSGEYKFYVRAMSASEIVSEVSGPVVIIKQAYFYETPWFYILVVLSVILIAWLIYIFRVRHLKRSSLKLERIVDQRTAELQELQHSLERQVQERTQELRRERNNLQDLSFEVTSAFARTIDAKDAYTKGHSARVAEYSRMIAAKMKKSPEEQDNIFMIAVLHDIGKIGIPDSIINKPGRLTDEEYEIIKRHSQIGGEILKQITTWPEIGIGAKWHHERYDGTGYPDGLSGKSIPEIARIIAVADAYDAMTSNRSYRQYLSQDVVRQELLNGKGTQFDPEIADMMIEIIDGDKNYCYHE